MSLGRAGGAGGVRRARRDTVWFFDLDDTLHHATPHIFPHMNRLMTAYVMEHLALDEAAASALRESYWHRYGATLLGLMKRHGTDPRHFLAATHQFPDLAAMVVNEKRLRQTLRALPGVKVLFSNAPKGYVSAVLALLKIDDLFVEVVTMESLKFRPKPSTAAMRRVFARHPARYQIMVEDNLPNLRTARRCGLGTVWMRPDKIRFRGRPCGVDLTVKSLQQVRKSVGAGTL